MKGATEVEEGLKEFREWVVRVGTNGYNPDWVMPVSGKGRRAKFVFTIDAYNYFRSHSLKDLPEVQNVEELYDLVEGVGRVKRPKLLRYISAGLLPLARPIY